MKYSEVVQTVYFDPVDIELEDRMEQDIYKADVIKNNQGEYRIVLYRQDMYTIKPSFYKDQADEAFWILNDTHQINPETIVESTAERALKVLIERFSQFYGDSIN